MTTQRSKLPRQPSSQYDLDCGGGMACRLESAIASHHYGSAWWAQALRTVAVLDMMRHVAAIDRRGRTMTAGTWTDEFLDSMRQTGDPDADAAIEQIYADGQEEHVRKALAGFDRNSDSIPDDLPSRLREYFEKTAVLPDWSDPDRMERGNNILGQYQSYLPSTLLCSSLPMCYVCSDGVQVLYRSQRLTGRVYRRLVDTSQFLVDVLGEGGLRPGGHGVRTAQKIRLLHATMRYHVSRQSDWDSAWGHPVNQEDIAVTLTSFSVVVPLGLQRLGIDLRDSDRDDYFHIWRVIGHILGVDPRLNPADFEAAQALNHKILDRQQSPSEAGRALTKALLDFIRETLPGSELVSLGPTLIRHLAGDDRADILDVPPRDWTGLATSLALDAGAGYSMATSRSTNTVPLAKELAAKLGDAVLKSGIRVANNGQRSEWQIPTGLTDAPEKSAIS
jgi:hypothetical protein